MTAAEPTSLPKLALQQVPSLRVLPSERRRVILAEDDFELRTFLCEALVDAGYDVTECRTGDELWETLERADPGALAAIVSDHRMPGQEGLTVLERLRSNKPPAPFILITAFGGHDLHRRARELGADLVLDKPVDEDELVEVIRTLAD